MAGSRRPLTRLTVVEAYRMTESLFNGSFIKLQRANRFIDDLEQMLKAFNNSQPFAARFDFSVTPPQILLDWKGLSREVGAVLGDAVHNLRTALDLVASELARINGKSDRNVYFPFATSAAEFPGAVAKRNFDKAGQEAVDLLHTFAPYRGGNELLRAIHDLDIEDKHTALLETEKTMNIQLEGSYDITNPSTCNISLEGSSIEHYFSSESPLKGKPVIETLREAHMEVFRVVEAFRALVLARAGRRATDSESVAAERRKNG